MGARHKTAKTTYDSRAKGSIPRTITIDRDTDALLMEMSHGQFSAFIRCLVWREAGRREGVTLATAQPAKLDTVESN